MITSASTGRFNARLSFQELQVELTETLALTLLVYRPPCNRCGYADDRPCRYPEEDLVLCRSCDVRENLRDLGGIPRSQHSKKELCGKRWMFKLQKKLRA